MTHDPIAPHEVAGGEANASADNATALAARLNVNGKLLAVSDYVAQDLSAITNDSGSLVVTTSDTEKSTLGKAELSKVTQIKIGDGTASVSASDVHDLGAAKFVSNSNTDDANQIEVVDYIAGKNIAAIDDNLKVIVATSVSNTGSNTLDLDPLLLGSIAWSHIIL